MKKITFSGFLNLFTSKDLVFESSGESSFKMDFSKFKLKDERGSNHSRRGISSIMMLLILFLCSNFLSAQAVDFSQAANNNGTLGDVQWINGILNNNNSKYYEGMSTFQRIVITNIPSSNVVGSPNTHTFRIKMQSEKGGHHSYDFITSWEAAEAQANAT
jgi:hypothetical protein